MPHRLAALPLDTADLVRVERLKSALRGRIIGRADAMEGAAWRTIYIARGSAEVISDGAPPMQIAGPAVAWVPWSQTCRLRIGAGTVGIHVLVGARAVTNAIGHKPESADLKQVAEHRARIELDGSAPLRETVDQCFNGILQEAERNSAASATVIESFLRILLILIWRAQGKAEAFGLAATPAQRLMTRFNGLVEAHFRDRWTVARYAETVGVSTDRLTDICRRLRGRTPKQLIDARIGTEARLLLEDSTLSIEQIAGLLGFASPAHFNRFFRKLAGMPPGKYRKLDAAAERDDNVRIHSALYDWP
ncbi:MAG: helix-turn-helix domain-containing protein [Rhodobacteraceae bacterium]|nr:helix-turn-helix domain-containing protein [Paracoccaceae bacterium]